MLLGAVRRRTSSTTGPSCPWQRPAAAIVGEAARRGAIEQQIEEEAMMPRACRKQLRDPACCTAECGRPSAVRAGPQEATPCRIRRRPERRSGPQRLVATTAVDVAAAWGPGGGIHRLHQRCWMFPVAAAAAALVEARGLLAAEGGRWRAGRRRALRGRGRAAVRSRCRQRAAAPTRPTLLDSQSLCRSMFLLRLPGDHKTLASGGPVRGPRMLGALAVLSDQVRRPRLVALSAGRRSGASHCRSRRCRR